MALRGVQMHGGMGCIGVTSTWWDPPHDDGRIDLLARPGRSHVGSELMLHARDGAGLAGVVRHAGGHGMALGGAWVLLHPDWVRRKRRTHHLECCQLSTARMSTSSPPCYRMRSLASVAIIQCVWDRRRMKSRSASSARARVRRSVGCGGRRSGLFVGSGEMRWTAAMWSRRARDRSQQVQVSWREAEAGQRRVTG